MCETPPAFVMRVCFSTLLLHGKQPNAAEMQYALGGGRSNITAVTNILYLIYIKLLIYFKLLIFLAINFFK